MSHQEQQPSRTPPIISTMDPALVTLAQLQMLQDALVPQSVSMDITITFKLHLIVWGDR